jgi:hypothetical protein
MEQGIVNPSTLLVRSMRWRVFGEIDLAIRMWLKKRISLTKLLHGLLKMERLNTQDELIALGAAVKYEENQKVEE